MTQWQSHQITFKYQISDWTFFSLPMRMQVKFIGPFSKKKHAITSTPSKNELMDNHQGFLLRDIPIDNSVLPILSTKGDFLQYVPLQYEHYFIDLGLTFEEYQKKFSSKTRSTIRRKVKKYAAHCGGNIYWKAYIHTHEIRGFFHLAGMVSKLTYQTRLLDAGLPETEAFILEAEKLAAQNRLRAYILFDGNLPVSYLYCPVKNGILSYSYQGYDPDYMKFSVGTVLQWLATEQLFHEACFRYFDFTEGQSDHKRLFATHNQQCANIYLLKNTIRNNSFVRMHILTNRFSSWLGKKTEQLGIKAKIKSFLRKNM